MEGIQGTDWHRASMVRFYGDGLRDLLRRRIGATIHICAESGPTSVDVTIGLEPAGRTLQATYAGLPLPDKDGVFLLGDRRIVVVPVAESEDLDGSRVLCAGEQLLGFLSERVGCSVPEDADEELLRGLLPLDGLIRSFLETTGQTLDETNVYSRITHLRRLLNPDGRRILPGSQPGRVCPVDMPEKPERLGKVLTVSRGARIEGQRIVVRSTVPEDRLGPVAAMIPFLHHTDPVRAQIGVNHMRQWRAAAGAEPALVRTGLEPEIPGLWLGCNLLTAFASHGKDTFGDSLLLSRSAADRLGLEAATETGALLSNRHGQKGVVGRVLPDGRMPRLEDGTPVELMVSFIGLHTRRNAGQLLEAAAGWIARSTGRPYVAPPFAEGDLARLEHELSEAPHRQRLRMDGDRLTDAACLAGPVYWGVCTPHASNRLAIGGAGGAAYQRQGEMETRALIRRGAYLTILERFTSLASEPARDPGFCAPFGNLERKLYAAGIRAEPGARGLSFRLAEPEGDALPLATPLAHPWLPGHAIRSLGRLEDAEGFTELRKANAETVRCADLPGSLRQARTQRLQALLDRLFDSLLGDLDLRLGNRVLRSGRGMLAVGEGLSVEQAGIPRRMADALFGGIAPEWVVINRAPTLEPTAIIAFRPVVVDGDAVRLNPYVCRWMDADFDGDQVAVLVPGSAGTQEEAGRLLSVPGHLRADPAVLDTLAPDQEALWGLARLWLSADGRRTVLDALPDLGTTCDRLEREGLRDGLRRAFRREGAEAAAAKAVALWDLGFREAERSGATLDPFALARVTLPEAPAGRDPDALDRHAEHCIQALASRRDYGNPALGAQLLAVHSGARGDERQLLSLASGRGLLHGLDFAAYEALAAADHQRIARNAAFWTQEPHAEGPEGHGVLARAMRSRYPGIVFARAAAAGETDPLTDTETRLFVGLPPLE